MDLGRLERQRTGPCTGTVSRFGDYPNLTGLERTGSSLHLTEPLEREMRDMLCLGFWRNTVVDAECYTS